MTSRWCCIYLAGWSLAGPWWNRLLLQTSRSTVRLVWPYGSPAEPTGCWSLNRWHGQFASVKQKHRLDLFYSTRLTHAHWSAASRLFLDVCSDCSGQICWADTQLANQSRSVYQHFITTQCLDVMGVTAKKNNERQKVWFRSFCL